jgi:anthranilate phosphoribosyltransferase
MSALAGDFAAILDGQAQEPDITAFLVRSIDLMSDPHALATGAKALRARMVKVLAPEAAIDVCGTGGDGAHSLNISTAVAFVCAGSGVTVAKHGNRAMSSRSGAADVLEALGVRLTGEVALLEAALVQARVAFLFAQNHHPAMRHVAAARRALGRRTIFNLLGPLCNPAGVKRQLVGVFDRALIGPMARALQLLAADRALIAHGHGGLDELAIDGPSACAELRDGAVSELTINPAELRLYSLDAAGLRGGDAAFNAAALRALLDGRSKGSAYEAIVALNAGAALALAGRATDLNECIALARDALADGSAAKACDALIAITQQAAP